MKLHLNRLTWMLIASILLFTYSCKKGANSEETITNTNVIPESVILEIKKMGYSTHDVRNFKDGYIVEGDIFIPKTELGKTSETPNLQIAKTEQYKTYNLVRSLPRVITVSCNMGGVYETATDAAIARYNALSLKLTFQRVSSGGEIDISGFDQEPYPDGSILLGVSPQPPSDSGNPGASVQINTNPYALPGSANVGYVTSVIQHEMGHSIGFRHTDYATRSSCGDYDPESDPGIGNVLIPGTPSGFDNESLMLACNNTKADRGFNPNDIIALNYLYGGPERIPRTIKSNYFNNVFLRLDGRNVPNQAAGGGVVNCQYTATAFERFYFIPQGDGSYAIESYTFPNVFLRMDGANVPNGSNGGTVNAKNYPPGPYEKFYVTFNFGGTYTISSQYFSNRYLRMDGSNVTNVNSNGAGYVNVTNNVVGPYEQFIIYPGL
jgi:hypothetical protein